MEAHIALLIVDLHTAVTAVQYVQVNIQSSELKLTISMIFNMFSLFDRLIIQETLARQVNQEIQVNSYLGIL